MNSQNILVSKVSGSENFLREFLKPSFNNTLLSNEMLDLMVEYYLATYVLSSLVVSSSAVGVVDDELSPQVGQGKPLSPIPVSKHSA